MLLTSLNQDSLIPHQPTFPEPRVALLVLSCLFVLWYALWLWRTHRTRQTPLLAYICLATFLLLGYTLSLDLTGYVLLETGVALLYHMVVRVARGRFAAPGWPERTLNGLAIGLVVLVLLQTSAIVPLQLLSRTFFVEPLVQGVQGIHILYFPFTASRGDMLDLCALGVCLLVTLDMAAGQRWL